MKIKTLILWICLLVILDQGSKLIINTWFFDTRFTLIPSLLEFYPKFNYNHSYANDLLDLGVGKWVHITLFFLILLCYIPIYVCIRNASHKKKLVDWAGVFAFSGIISAIICNIFWEGVLDFVYLVPLFIFDLKDVYINIFVVLLIISFLKYPHLINSRRMSAYQKWQKRNCRNRFR